AHQGEARKLWMALAQEMPAHPLAELALQRAAPPSETKPGGTAAAATAVELGAPERIKRAETLAKDRHWDEALDELGKVPAQLPPELGAERDYQIGMTKFHMRRDYPRAAELLLGAAPLLTGDRAASAAFHGARALSRVDRDDEAIAGYRKVVAKFPRSRFAAEAQYRSGWLDFNRGRFRESLPGLQATLDQFGTSAFADDAAWCVAFAHYLLGDSAEALAGFERYARLPVNDGTGEERRARVAYWRSRVLEKTGRKDDARAGYRDSFRRAPLSYYGLLARARLQAMGADAGAAADAAAAEPARAAAGPPARVLATGAEPALARADELLEAGMAVEASWEIERSEAVLLRRLGDDAGLPSVLDRYRRATDF